MPIKLSFIIPIYNVENYLRECVDSILEQANDMCEIILVDDGSPDACGVICDEYKNQNKLVRVIHQANQGLSGARNAGLDIASGEYIAFVDADDRIASDSIIQILENLSTEKSDVIFMHVERFYPDGTKNLLDKDFNQAKISDKKEKAIKYLTSRNKYPGAAWSKLYRKEFLEQWQIRFPDDRRLSEDLGFTMQCLFHAKQFNCYNTPYYEYRQGRQGSITSTASMKTIDGLHLFIAESSDYLCINKKPNGVVEKYLMSFVAYEYSMLLHVVNVREVDDSKFLDQYKWALKFAVNYRLRVIYLLSTCIGIMNTAKIVRWVKKRVK